MWRDDIVYERKKDEEDSVGRLSRPIHPAFIAFLFIKSSNYEETFSSAYLV